MRLGINPRAEVGKQMQELFWQTQAKLRCETRLPRQGIWRVGIHASGRNRPDEAEHQPSEHPPMRFHLQPTAPGKLQLT